MNEEQKQKHREANKKWNERNKERIKEYNKEYRIQNREKLKSQSKKYYYEHQEEQKEMQRKRYLEKREQIIEKKHNYYLENIEKCKAQGRLSYYKNKEFNKQKYENSKQNIVYKYTEISTGELAYIGSTCNQYERLRRRMSKSANVKFDKIYQNNPENYSFDIICYTNSREEAYELEKYYIKTLHPKYNIVFNK